MGLLDMFGGGGGGGGGGAAAAGGGAAADARGGGGGRGAGGSGGSVEPNHYGLGGRVEPNVGRAQNLPGIGSGFGGGGGGGGGGGRNNNGSNKQQQEKPDAKSFQAFDPEGLERAAKAMRELSSSPNAAEALEIAKQQEISKQLEYKQALQRQQMQMQQAEAVRVERMEQERRKTSEQDHYLKKQELDYRHKLEKKRQDDKLAEKKWENDERQRKEFEHRQRMENEKRKTIREKADLQMKVDQERIRQEVMGSIKQERENKDIHLEMQREEAAEVCLS